MLRLDQGTIIPGRGHFKHILAGHGIVNIKQSCCVVADLLAILKANPFRPVDIEAHPLPPALQMLDADEFVTHFGQGRRQQLLESLSQRQATNRLGQRYSPRSADAEKTHSPRTKKPHNRGFFFKAMFDW